MKFQFHELHQLLRIPSVREHRLVCPAKCAATDPSEAARFQPRGGGTRPTSPPPFRCLNATSTASAHHGLRPPSHRHTGQRPGARSSRKWRSSRTKQWRSVGDEELSEEFGKVADSFGFREEAKKRKAF